MPLVPALPLLAGTSVTRGRGAVERVGQRGLDALGPRPGLVTSDLYATVKADEKGVQVGRARLPNGQPQ
jgi:hypothetical protein